MGSGRRVLRFYERVSENLREFGELRELHVAALTVGACFVDQEAPQVDAVLGRGLETIVQKVKYLEKHESDNIKLYKCDENIIRLLGIECDQSFNTTEDFFQEMRIENDKLYRTGLSDYGNDRFNLREDYSWGF